MTRKAKQRKHTVRVTVTFDKPITQTQAVKALSYQLRGQELSASIYEEECFGWGEATIRSVTREEPQP